MRGAAALTDAGCAALRERARETAPIGHGPAGWRADPHDERIAWGAASPDGDAADLDVSRDTQGALIVRRALHARGPLYFRIKRDRIEWDRDPQRLVRSLGIKREIDVGSLLHLLWRGRAQAGHALLQGIRALHAGEELRCAPGAPPVVRRAAWPIHALPVSHDAAGLQEEALSRLRTAVHRVAEAERPVALFLSGGLDSGLLAALLRERHAVTGYTIAFDDHYGLNETDYAATVACVTGIRHRIVRLDVDHARHLLERILAAPFPLTAPAAVTHAALIEATVADGHAVAVSGLGADECFGGYHKPLTCLAAQMHHQRRLGVDLAGLYDLPLARLLGLDDVLFFGIAEFFTLDEMRRLSRDPQAVDALLADDVGFYRQLLAAKPEALPTEAMAAHEYVFRIGELLLPALADNVLMHGPRLDFPFLHPDVYGWASALDPGLSYWHEADAWWAKRLLRQVAGRYLPPEIVMRKRQVLLAPIAHWLLDARFRTRVLDEIADSDLWRIVPLSPRFRTTLLSRLRAYDDIGDDNRWHEQLWVILVSCGWINRHSTSG